MPRYARVEDPVVIGRFVCWRPDGKKLVESHAGSWGNFAVILVDVCSLLSPAFLERIE
jgi:hypothetical protein